MLLSLFSHQIFFLVHASFWGTFGSFNVGIRQVIIKGQRFANCKNIRELTMLGWIFASGTGVQLDGSFYISIGSSLIGEKITRYDFGFSKCDNGEMKFLFANSIFFPDQNLFVLTLQLYTHTHTCLINQFLTSPFSIVI